MKSLVTTTRRNNRGSLAGPVVIAKAGQTGTGGSSEGIRSPVKGLTTTLSEAVEAPKGEHVFFQCFFPRARQVAVAGTFNGWRASDAPMRCCGSGQWKLDLELKPGRYEYRLVVDGAWVDDPRARTFVANCYGTRNGVLIVSGPIDEKR